MMPAIRFKADLAEEHPDGNLVGVEAIEELEQRIEELYDEGTEIFDAGEGMALAIAQAVETGKVSTKLEKAAARWKEVTGGEA